MAKTTVAFIGLGMFDKVLPRGRSFEKYLLMFSFQEYDIWLLPLAIWRHGSG